MNEFAARTIAKAIIIAAHVLATAYGGYAIPQVDSLLQKI